MATAGEHIEVAPRMWDQSIASQRIGEPEPMSDMRESQSDEHQSQQETLKQNRSVVRGGAKAIAAGATGFFSRFRKYLVPAMIVIAVLFIIYVLWKYFTKYRGEKEGGAKQEIVKINACDIPDTRSDSSDPPPNPMALIASEDMSKYEYNSSDDEEESEDEASEEDDESEEGSDEDDEDYEEDASDDEEEDDDTSDEEEEDAMSVDRFNAGSDHDEPDLKKIEQMILENTNHTFEDSSIPVLEEDETKESEDDDDPFSIKSPYISGNASAKKPKKAKRVTL